MLPPFLRRHRCREDKRKQLNSPLQKIQDSIDAEKHRLDCIRDQLESDPDIALRSLLSDTGGDLSYFNAIKNEEDPQGHSEAFLRRHGKLIDFTCPKEKRPPKDCMWVGLHNKQKYRCHNNSLVCDGKELHHCVYHTKWCINKENHPDVPVKILCPNESALCNECFVVRYGHAPKHLARIPGTKKVR